MNLNIYLQILPKDVDFTHQSSGVGMIEDTGDNVRGLTIDWG